MPTVGLPKANYVILQLVSTNGTKDSAVKEEMIFIFQRLPESITYSETGRNQITKVNNTFFKDVFTGSPIKVSLTGNHGEAAIWSGTKLTTGVVRLQMFRAIIKSYLDQKKLNLSDLTLTVEEKPIFNQVNKIIELSSNENKTFFLNYYDFLSNRFFSVDINQMSTVQDGRRNAKAVYWNLSMTESGPVILATEGQSTFLTRLIQVTKFLSGIISAINTASDALLDNTIVQEVAADIELSVYISDLIQYINLEVLPTYSADIATNNPISSFQNRFGIKI